MKNKILNIYNPINWDNPVNYKLAAEWVGLSNTIGNKVIDIAGKNHGTLTGGVNWSLGGANNFNSLNFDGVNDYVDIPYNNLDFEYTDSFSFVSVVNLTSAANSRTFFGRTNGTNKGIYFVASLSSGTSRNANSLGLRLYNDSSAGNGLTASTATGSMPTGVWLHVVATYDGSSSANGIKIYFNGISMPMTVFNNSISGTAKTNTNWRIGDDGTNDWMLGKISYVSVYKRVLSNNDIYRLYTEYKLGNPNRYNWHGTTKYYLPLSVSVSTQKVLMIGTGKNRFLSLGKR